MPQNQDPTPGTQLLVEYCAACARWVHPPAGSCPGCGAVLTARPVSGRGKVFSYTVNHHGYNPAIPTPYVIAIVELDEQDGLLTAANIVDCEPDSVSCGMPVRVRFTPDGTVFGPAAG